MKRSQQRMPMTLNRQAYPSDLTDEQWELLEPLVPALCAEAAYHVHARRELVNAILYALPSAKVVIDGAPGGKLMGQQPPGAPSITTFADGNGTASGSRPSTRVRSRRAQTKSRMD